MLARLSSRFSGVLEAALSRDLSLDGIVPDPRFHPIFPDEGMLARAEAIVEGRFTFLNRTAVFPDEVDWEASGVDRLWRFNLHYFDFGLDLALAFHATKERRYAERFAELAESWMSRSPLGKGDAWHPYPLSLRLVNWIWAWHLFGEALDALKPTLGRSMALQARYLLVHLERDIGGNHLIKNAKALALAGAFLGDAPLMERGLRLLEAQVRHQVLPDGGHFERSPMYHEQVLQDLAETAWYLRATWEQVIPWLDSALASMSDWLVKVTLPDGEIPLFGDSAIGIAPSPGAILALVNGTLGTDYPAQEAPFPSALAGRTTSELPHSPEGAAVETLEDSGFVVMRHDAQVMVIDGGPFAPDELPAHGHCDALSFELALGRERFIVDSGTFAYTGPRRSYYRGTAAHNTLALPGREQTEIWGDFRAGRRARIVTRTVKAVEGGTWIDLVHDGFRPLLHRRQVWFVPGVFWLVADTLEGGHAPGAASFLHLHPERDLQKTEAGALLRGAQATLQILALGGGSRWESGHYSERFGQETSNPVMALELDSSGSATYLLLPHERHVTWNREGGGFLVSINGRGDFCLTPGHIKEAHW